MTRPLAISKRQAKTLLKAAAETGGVVEVQTVIGTVRLLPPQTDKPSAKGLDPEPEGTM